MKRFEVRMTMLVAVSVEVEADNEEQAEKRAMEKTVREEAYYLQHYDSIWEREVTEVNECEDEDDDPELTEALDYVREQLGPETLAIIKAQVDRSYRYHMAPSDCVTEDGKVIDLLEEYGQDNDLPEGWWENEGDIDDILLRL